MAQQPIQKDLFGQSAARKAELALWRRDPQKAFEAFVASKQYVLLGERPPATDRDGEPYTVSYRSRVVYIAMFGSFVRWLQHNKVPIFEVSSADLLRFLDQRTAEKKDVKKVSRIRADYLRLLKRVFIHLEVSPNPARALAFDVKDTPGATGRNKPTPAIPQDKLKDFIAHLPNSTEPGEWKRRRDRAMQALMLGAGLSVAEVIRLRAVGLGRVCEDGSIPVTIERNAVGGVRKPHTTYLWPELVPIVLAWLAERLKLGIGGSLLFPAGPIGGVGAGKPLNPATVWRQTKATYTRAGINVARPGCRTLRNTFAARELVNGTPRATVSEYLGHHEKRTIAVYDQAATTFKSGAKASQVKNR